MRHRRSRSNCSCIKGSPTLLFQGSRDTGYILIKHMVIANHHFSTHPMHTQRKTLYRGKRNSETGSNYLCAT